MIKEIKNSEIKNFIKNNPETVLLDVRTYEEWSTVGKPDSTILGIKTFFITITQDPSFIENVKKEINKKKNVLVMCAAGSRSAIAADLLSKEGYQAVNITGGYTGNDQDPGWVNSDLPSV